jgi:hypothetical protein
MRMRMLGEEADGGGLKALTHAQSVHAIFHFIHAAGYTL